MEKRYLSMGGRKVDKIQKQQKYIIQSDREHKSGSRIKRQAIILFQVQMISLNRLLQTKTYLISVHLSFQRYKISSEFSLDW